MSTPQGDLPDWQTLTSPVFQNASGSVNNGSPTFVLISSPSPFRLWQVTLVVSMWSVAAPPAAGDGGSVVVEDGTGAFVIGVPLQMMQAITQVHFPVVLSMYGYQPKKSGGLYQVIVNSNMSGTATKYTHECAALFSQP